MDWNEKIKFNESLSINFLRAKHWSKRAFWGSNATLWGAFGLETNLGNIYFAGDTGYDSHFAEAGQKFKNFKLALLPIGAYKPKDFMIRHHIDPAQAILAHKELNSEKSIAMHFETFQLASDNFTDPAKDLKKHRKEANLENDFLILEVGENQEF
jgi:L-ascorbate metabolism protein UlaG (beta-lactamase superfamily)